MSSKTNNTLPTLDWLVSEGYGDVSLGRFGTEHCVAAASDQDSQLASLVRRDGETLIDLLLRLDKAVDKAYQEQIYTDEIDGP